MQEAVQKKTLRKGILVAIEGIDGAGKTTQSKILCERLKKADYSVVLLHEPTNGKYGEKIRDLAKNGRNKTTPEEEMNLFFEDRKEDVEINIKPNLKNKSIVIMDRYYFSSVAYQGARGLNPDYVEKKNEEIAPLPDVLIILDITPQITVKRIIATRKDGPNHFEQSKCLETVRELFNSQFAKRNYAKIIDGNGNHSAEEISKRIWDIVKPIIRDAEES